MEANLGVRNPRLRGEGLALMRTCCAISNGWNMEAWRHGGGHSIRSHYHDESGILRSLEKGIFIDFKASQRPERAYQGCTFWTDRDICHFMTLIRECHSDSEVKLSPFKFCLRT